MDLMSRSLNFWVRSLDTLCLLVPIYSGSSTDKTATARTSKSSVGSSTEVNSPANIQPTESNSNLTDPLDEIPRNLNFEDASDLPCQSGGLEGNFDCNNNFDSEEDFTDLSDGVSYGSEEEWMSSLEIQDDEPTIFFSEPYYSNNTCSQVYATIEEASKDLDSANNAMTDPTKLKRGSKYIETDEATIATREKNRLIAIEWTTIRAAINGTTHIPLDASREVLMGYQYALYRQGRRLQQV
jgi:hypothetical protein